MKTIDLVTKQEVTVVRTGGPGAERCVVIRHKDGSTHLQFKSLLKKVK